MRSMSNGIKKTDKYQPRYNQRLNIMFLGMTVVEKWTFKCEKKLKSHSTVKIRSRSDVIVRLAIIHQDLTTDQIWCT